MGQDRLTPSHKDKKPMKVVPNKRAVINKRLKKDSIQEIDMKIIILLLEGYTNEQIGERVFLSKRTVDGHLYKLRNRYEAKNTYNLIYILMKRKIFTIK